MSEGSSALNKDLKFSGTFIAIILHSSVALYALFFVELLKTNNKYLKKLHSLKQNVKQMIILAWKVKELSELNKIGRNLFSSIKVLLSKVDRQNSMTEGNIPS